MMNVPLRLVVHGMMGLVLGAACVLIGIVTTVALAVATDGRAGIPGVFEAWMEPYQGSPSFAFVPDMLGLGGSVVLVAVAYVTIALAIGRATSRRGR